MNIEPCVRFGMRIRPKISEKPAESRNSRPPRVMLLTARISHRFMTVRAPFPRCGTRGTARGKVVSRAARSPSRVVTPPAWRERFRQAEPSALQRRIVARIYRLFQEPLLVERPELADVRIGLDGVLRQLAVLLHHL